MVAASSRHGLYTLVKRGILSVDEFNTTLHILNPEKSVGKIIFREVSTRYYVTLFDNSLTSCNTSGLIKTLDQNCLH